MCAAKSCDALKKTDGIDVAALMLKLFRLHNHYRAKHGSPPLEMCADIAKFAQKHADRLANADKVQCDTDRRYGENIFVFKKYGPVTNEEIVKACMITLYHDEARGYNYTEHHVGNKNTSHFTQIVWHDTRKIGIGVGINKGPDVTNIYICMKYDPIGNWPEKESYEMNVLKPGTPLTFRKPANLSEPDTVVDRKTLTEELLRLHNQYREQHGSPPLERDDEIDACAQAYAKKLAAKNEGNVHENDGKHGENLYSRTLNGLSIGAKTLAEESFMAFYNERLLNNGYNYSNHTKGNDLKVVAHFTQIVWHDTRKMGVGVACSEPKDSRINIFVCIKYAPPGNWESEEAFKLNVFPEGTKADYRKAIEAISIEVDTFSAEVLRLHNLYREQHGTQLMTLDKTLSEKAQACAESMTKNNKLAYDEDTSYGETIANYRLLSIPQTAELARTVVSAFYDQGKGYNYKNKIEGNQFEKTGNFTQIIWYNSTKLGVGISISKIENSPAYSVFVCCKYNPPGNAFTKEQFDDNIFEPGTKVINRKPRAATDNVQKGSAASQAEVQRKDGPKEIDAKALADEILHLHNAYRADHGTRSLSLDNALCSKAQELADEMAKNQKLDHEKDIKEGRTSFTTRRAAIPTPAELAKIAMTALYDEGKGYNYENKIDGNSFEKTGNFTQIVWYESTKIGVGVGISKTTDAKTYDIYLCCTYDPPGNILTKDLFDDNIFPPGTKIIKRKGRGEIKPEIKELAEEVLRLHNEYRAKHGTPPMTLDVTLLGKAQVFADKMAKTKKMDKEKDMKEGRTSYFCRRETVPNGTELAKMAMAALYEEGKGFNYDNKIEGNKFEKTGNFTQLIWYESNKLGVGLGISKADGNMQDIFLCCTYDPPGNIYSKEQFDDNVFPPGTKVIKRKKKDEKPKGIKIVGVEKVTKIDTKEVAAEALAVHNECRLKHGSPPVEYDVECEAAAQKYAEKLAEIDKLEHEGDAKYGENLYKMILPNIPETFDAKLIGKSCVMSFYNERLPKYDYEDQLANGKDHVVGHFTQMIWYDTKKIGVGTATNSKNGRTVIYVCVKYFPTGNIYMNDIYKLNVFPEGTPVTQRAQLETKTIDPVQLGNEMARAHNVYRKKHGAQTIVWCPAVSKKAQEQANKMAAAGKIVFDTDRSYGENCIIFQKTVIPFAYQLADEFCKAYYEKGKDFDYMNKIESGKKASSFVQIIWAETRRLGCGVAIKQVPNAQGVLQYKIFVCIKYDPQKICLDPKIFEANINPPV